MNAAPFILIQSAAIFFPPPAAPVSASTAKCHNAEKHPQKDTKWLRKHGKLLGSFQHLLINVWPMLRTDNIIHSLLPSTDIKLPREEEKKM